MYSIPPSCFAEIATKQSAASIIELISNSGASLEVSVLEPGIWSFEVRFDKEGVTSYRQPFTGAQDDLKRLQLNVTESKSKLNAEQILIQSPTDRCEFSQDGSFRISNNKSGAPWFESGTAPFRSHPHTITADEGIMSPKVTDFSAQASFWETKKFDTLMRRFQYPRPQGPILGLPGQTGELNRNGYRFELNNTDTFLHTPARKPMYQSWPILFHKALDGGWIGLFFDNPSRTFVDLGDFDPKLVSFDAIQNNIRVYIAHGDSLECASSKISQLLGGVCFPPAWAFGYQQCRWGYRTSDEVLAVSKNFRKAAIPCDAIYFDIDYMDDYRVFTTSPDRFGQMARHIKEMKEDGFRCVAIVDPGVKSCPGEKTYESIVATDKYLKEPDGSPFIGKVWPGKSIFPDFIEEEVRQVWAKLQSEWLSEFHFDGIWNDMNEPANFDGQNASTSRAVTSRGSFKIDNNLYGFFMALASSHGWKEYSSDTRTLIISRSGYPGLQKFGVIWHGDNQCWWEHLRLAIDTMISYSLAGAIYTGADVPGFNGSPPDDLAVRFFQLGAFMPFFRGHSIFFAKDKEPYAFEPETRTRIEAAIRLRYSLLREWYSNFELARRNNIPLIQPIFAEDHLVRDQFLIFDKLLIAPVTNRDEKHRAIYLPKGEWYRWENTTSKIAGNQWIMEPISLNSIPIFVKAGSVVIRNEPLATVEQTLNGKERFDIYPDKDGSASGYWFEDDRISISSRVCQRKIVKVSNFAEVKTIDI